MTALVEINSVSKSYGGFVAVDNLTLSVPGFVIIVTVPAAMPR
ncbi:MAG TPA: hypothetical protein VN946_13170 [Terriglobales bacterium]|jgi:ABC-type Fe3+/spermidine/putrescine transport system ATPase subunit|nr:hypothetical protein [Terriglobales bacterium]